MSVAAFSQGDPGGLGAGTGSGGDGGDVEDVSGGSGTTGGNQGAEVPIENDIFILFAAGASLMAIKIYQIAKEKKITNLQL